jgi:hypothetical protein
MKIDLRVLMVIQFVAYCLLELWTILPDRGLINPFPLAPDSQTYFQSYIWAGCIYLNLMVSIFMCQQIAMHHANIVHKARLFFNAAFILQFLIFVEYWLNYNRHWFYIISVPVNMTIIRFICLFIIMVNTLVKWQRT